MAMAQGCSTNRGTTSQVPYDTGCNIDIPRKTQHCEMTREVAAGIICKVAGDRCLPRHLPKFKNVTASNSFQQIVKVELLLLDEKVACGDIPGADFIFCKIKEVQNLVRKESHNKPCFEAKLTHYLTTNIVSNVNWVLYKQHTTTLLFAIVEALTQAIRGLCIPYDEQEALYFSVLNSVYEVSGRVQNELECYWVPLCRLWTRQATETQRQCQRKASLQDEYDMLNRCFAISSMKFPLTKTDIHKVSFEDVTREVLVAIISGMEKENPCLFQILSNLPDMHSLCHYKDLINFIKQNIQQQKGSNKVTWARNLESSVQDISCYYAESPSILYEDRMEKFIQEKIVNDHLWTDKWDSITVLFYLLDGVVQQICCNRNLNLDRKIPLYMALADACYFAFAGAQRPQDMQTYMQWK